MSRIDSRFTLGEDLVGEITEEKKVIWEKRLGKAKEKAKGSEKVKELDTLFRQDPVKRQEGEAALIYRWKTEYRNMA